MLPEIRRREVPELPDLDGVSAVLRRVYGARGVRSTDDLTYELERLPDFTRLSGIEVAVELLSRVVMAGGRIVVVGDYDADGATSCAVAARALEGMGAPEVVTRVPNRFTDGYGLTPAIVASVAELEPSLVLTVDNGIASIDGVAEARRRGLPVVITDHHLPGPELPDADALIDPNLPEDGSGLGYLAGVGVVFLLMVALRSALRDGGWFARPGGVAEPNLADLLDLVALGTVADVVPLEHGNRLLVRQGLLRMRRGRCQPGIRALAEVAGRDLSRLNESDLGYTLGPRLNAAGRIEDMALGVRCLRAVEADEALVAARELDRLNRQRRSIESKMEGEALEALAELALERDEEMPAGLCLFDERWHQGVVGILASRLKERWHRPVVAFAPGDDGELRGSARSVRGVHIRDVIETIANRHPGVVGRFGGHAMAAGLGLERRHLDRFREGFEAEVDRVFPLEDRRGVVRTDGELAEEELDLELACEIGDGGPWGRAFPEPLFDGRFEVLERRVVGERHLKMRLRVPGGRRALDAIAFRRTDEDWPGDGPVEIEAAYRLEVNEFRGRRSPQLVVTHLRVV